MPTYTVHDAKTNLSKLIERAERGEEVVIARGEKPAVKLVPVGAKQPRRIAGMFKGMFALPDSFFDPLPEDELAAWEGKHSYWPEPSFMASDIPKTSKKPKRRK